MALTPITNGMSGSEAAAAILANDNQNAADIALRVSYTDLTGPPGKNLYKPTFNNVDAQGALEAGYISAPNSLNTAANTIRAKIDVSALAGGNVTISGYILPTVTVTNYPFFLVDASAAPIGTNGNMTTATTTIPVPAGAKYLYFGIRRPEPANAVDYTLIQVESGVVATAFQAYGGTINTIKGRAIVPQTIDGGAIINENAGDSYAASKGWIKAQGFGVPNYTLGKNLQDPTSVILDQWIIQASGAYVALVGAIMNKYVGGTVGANYVLSGYTHPSYPTQALSIRFENNAGGLLSFAMLPDPATSAFYTFVWPAGCAQIVYGIYRTSFPQDHSHIQLELGTVPTAYAAYTGKTVTGINGVPIAGASSTAATVYTLTLKNSTKIAMAGCSYIQGARVCIKNKSVVPSVSERLDIQVQNWGVGGDRTVDITDRFKRNTVSPYGTLGIMDSGVTYVTINNTGNEKVDALGFNADLYIEELEQLLQTVFSIGARPVFATDWFIGTFTVNNPLLGPAVKALADKYGAPFHDIGTTGEKLLTQGVPAIRWYGTHPDTRGNAHMNKEWAHYLGTVVPVEQSIKIFRPRSEYVVASAQALNYDNIDQRITKLAEITVGNYSMSEPTGAENVDRASLGDDTATNATTYADEYIALIAGSSAVSFTNYAVFQFILDRVGNSYVNLKIKTAANAGTKFWLKNLLDPTTYSYPAKNGSAVVLAVTKAVYDATVVVVGDTYTSPQVLNASAVPMSLIMEGKYFSPETGYIIGFHIASNAAPTTKTLDTAGTVTRTAGTGAASIVYLGIDSTMSWHSFPFLISRGAPDGIMTQVVGAHDGTYYTIAISAADMHKYINFDKIILVMELAGTFSITDVNAEYAAGTKKILPVKTYAPKATYANALIAEPTFTDTTLALWTLDAGVTRDQMPALHRDYPNLAPATPYHITLPFGVDYAPLKMKQSFAFASRTGYRKASVKIIARVFPKLYRPDIATEDTYVTHTRQIKPDSYDFGTLCLGIKGTGIVNTIKQRVVTGWAEYEFKFDVPPYTTAMELSVFRDFKDVIDTVNYRNHTYPLHVWYVSVEIE